jgi:hypothetical protein
MSIEQNKTTITIGRAEKIYLLDYLHKPAVAKVDTGADLSSIWATQIHEENGTLVFCLLGPESAEYTGESVRLPEGTYSITRVANSFGQRELRYMVKLRIKLAGRVVLASFTLADRSKKTYPILLGRRLLQGKFVVDVSKGHPLRQEERAKQEKLRIELKGHDDKLGKETT